MNDGTRQAIEAVTSHPKTAIAITAVFNANAWTDYAEPIIKASTSILGIIVLVLLVVKHALDIKKSHFTKGES